MSLPGGDQFWAAFHGGEPDRILTGEDGSGLIVARLDAEDTKIFLGGMSQSWLPYRGVHTALGALPALVHPRPERVAVVGLGSGDTVFAIGARSETTSIDAVEIMGPQLPLLRRLDARLRYPALAHMLQDQRIRHVVADARSELRRGRARYDIVETDALLPFTASAGNVYSLEYFSLLRDCLSPGGFAVTWVPTGRTHATFLAAFPYVVKIHDLAIGGLSPIRFDRTLVERRLAAPDVRRYFQTGGVDVWSALAPYLAAHPEHVDRSTSRAHLIDLNRDLFPKDEFGAGAR
jgi:hypothetical protein